MARLWPSTFLGPATAAKVAPSPLPLLMAPVSTAAAAARVAAKRSERMGRWGSLEEMDCSGAGARELRGPAARLPAEGPAGRRLAVAALAVGRVCVAALAVGSVCEAALAAVCGCNLAATRLVSFLAWSALGAGAGVATSWRRRVMHTRYGLVGIALGGGSTG